MSKMLTKILILIVEDDLSLAQMYATKLKAEGFEVDIAHDGREGLGKIRDEGPSLVLLDILMPNLDGIEMLRQAKADPRTQQIPIIVLTNLSLTAQTEQALRTGAEGYLVKSETTPNQVVKKIKSILATKEPKNYIL